MLEGFICPDGQQVKLKACFKQCRLGDRCQEIPDLHLMSSERGWDGSPSTTQLINGTMYEFLRLTYPYYVDPDKRAFMILGTKHHRELDKVAKKLGLTSEIALSLDRDIFDLLKWENKKFSLIDRKRWGSYKVAKALGIVEVGKQPDPSGAVYKTDSKWGKKGSPKMVSVFGVNPDKADNWEAEFQLNRYRIMLLEKAGIPIDEMYLRVDVRDGGLYIAYDRGIFRNTYKIPVKFLPDDMVKDYFEFKRVNLVQAMTEGVWTVPCTNKESWEGVRCKDWCELWEYCPKGRLVHSIGGSSG